MKGADAWLCEHSRMSLFGREEEEQEDEQEQEQEQEAELPIVLTIML